MMPRPNPRPGVGPIPLDPRNPKPVPLPIPVHPGMPQPRHIPTPIQPQSSYDPEPLLPKTPLPGKKLSWDPDNLLGSDFTKSEYGSDADDARTDDDEQEIYRERIRKVQEMKEKVSENTRAEYVDARANTIQYGREIQIQKEQDKFREDYMLKDLTTRSIIMFCNRYMTYRTGLLGPKRIQTCMDERVKEALQASPKGRSWSMHGTNVFENMSADNMIEFLKDFVAPTSQLDYYNKLNQSVMFPKISSKYDITYDNMMLYLNKQHTFIKE
jgi:hypothetical protein